MEAWSTHKRKVVNSHTYRVYTRPHKHSLTRLIHHNVGIIRLYIWCARRHLKKTKKTTIKTKQKTNKIFPQSLTRQNRRPHHGAGVAVCSYTIHWLLHVMPPLSLYNVRMYAYLLHVEKCT